MVDHAEQIQIIIEALTGYSGGFFSKINKISKVDEPLPKFLVIPNPDLFDNNHVQNSEFFNIKLQADSLANLETMINSILSFSENQPQIDFNTSNVIFSATANEIANFTASVGEYNLPTFKLNVVNPTPSMTETGNRKGGLWRFQLSNLTRIIYDLYLAGHIDLTTAFFFTTTAFIDATPDFDLRVLDEDNISHTAQAIALGVNHTATTASVVKTDAFIADTEHEFNVLTLLTELMEREDFEFDYLMFVAMNFAPSDSINTNPFTSGAEFYAHLDIEFDFSSAFVAVMPFFIKFKMTRKPYNSNAWHAIIECEARWSF